MTAVDDGNGGTPSAPGADIADGSDSPTSADIADGSASPTSADIADGSASPTSADIADGSASPTSAGRPRSGVRARLAGRTPFVLALTAILLITAAGVSWVLSPGWGGGSDGGITYTTRNVGVVPTVPGDLTDLTLSPNRIEIPRISAVAPIVEVGTDSNRELGVPLDPKIVGWWNGGARPGAKKGTAILDGHINYAGVRGVLADIGTLNPGDVVYVYGLHNGKKTRVAFTITGVRTYSKSALPYAEIFDQKSVGRLAIVTCGGPFNASTGNYRDNIVAFAVPAKNPT